MSKSPKYLIIYNVSNIKNSNNLTMDEAHKKILNKYLSKMFLKSWLFVQDAQKKGNANFTAEATNPQKDSLFFSDPLPLHRQNSCQQLSWSV